MAEFLLQSPDVPTCISGLCGAKEYKEKDEKKPKKPKKLVGKERNLLQITTRNENKASNPCALQHHFNDAMENVATATIEPDVLFAEQSPVDMVNADNKETEYEREGEKPMPTKNHGFVQANLIITLSQRYKHQYRIASEVTIGLLQRYATPDICLYPYSPVKMRHEEYPVAAPPLLVIEILSPSQSISELLNKAVFCLWCAVVLDSATTAKLVTVLHPNAEPRTFTATIVRGGHAYRNSV